MFGMAPYEVPFNEIRRPTPPARPERKVNQYLPFQLPTAEERSREQAYQRALQSYDEVVAGCEATFDALYGTAAGDASWIVWEEDRLLYDEVANMSPFQILDEEEGWLLETLKQETKARGYPVASEFRTLTVYDFESAGRTRKVCLIFSGDGLAHVFLPAVDFRDVWNEIHKNFDDHPTYETYLSRHVRPQPKSSYTSENYQVFVDRHYWVDGNRRILVISKDYALVVGALARIRAFFARKDFPDGELPVFLSYTDLSRRARTFETYRQKTLPSLRNALRDASHATRSVQEKRIAIERAKEEKQRLETKELLDGFR